MYRGFQASEVSHVGPLIGATVPLFTLAISYFFLPESLTSLQLGAVTLLVIGSFIISFEKSARTRAWREGVVWGTIAGFLFALFFSSAKVVYSAVGFVSGAVLVFGMMGVCGLLILFLMPNVRAAVEKKPSWFSKLFTKRPPVALIVVNKTMAFVAVGLVQYAITIGSVTIVNALTGLQYALLVIFVVLVSHFRPRLFKETYTKGEMAQEIIAVACIAVGVGLLLI
jgi:drug/metabolite transporter (DMT)-like permease